MEGTNTFDPTTTLPPGFVFDADPNPAQPPAEPPGGNSWSAVMQRVRDNPTPGGLVSIVERDLQRRDGRRPSYKECHARRNGH
jgi:hypothetical protein